MREADSVNYKEVEYSIIQTALPKGWKWTVFLSPTRTRTGIAKTREDAVLDAERAIDRAIEQMERDLKPRR